MKMKVNLNTIQTVLQTTLKTSLAFKNQLHQCQDDISPFAVANSSDARGGPGPPITYPSSFSYSHSNERSAESANFFYYYSFQ